MKTFFTTLGVIIGVAFVFGVLIGGGSYSGGYVAGLVFLPALVVAGIVAFINRNKE